MTRKDYVMIAKALELAGLHVDPQHQRTWLAEYLATRLHEDNERFDRSRFLKAAGVVP